VHLTPTERLLLTCLVRNAGRIVNHRELLETMSPGNPNESIAHLRACISRLRNKIEIDPALPRVIITHHRQGYSFLGKEEAGGFENLNDHDRYCLRIEMEMYHFVTNWFFQAPIQRVWEELIDVESWPTWLAELEKGYDPRHGAQSAAWLGGRLWGERGLALHLVLFGRDHRSPASQTHGG